MTKTAIIFGASRGLGRALTTEYLARGWRVIATVRQAGALYALRCAMLTEVVLDTRDVAAVDRLHASLAPGSIDLLFVNAGVMIAQETPIAMVTPEEFSELMEVNALAPLRIAERCADRVKDHGVIAVMSSGLGSITLNDSAGYEAYRMSKAALNMGLSSLYARIGGGRTWIAVDPGWVNTELGGSAAPLTPEQSIPGIADMLARHSDGGLLFRSWQDMELPW